MNLLPSIFRRLVLTAGIALAVPLAALAQAAPDDFDGILWGSMIERGPGPGGSVPFDHPVDGPRGPRGFSGPEGEMPEPPMLRGLALSEAQRDQVFAILHAQAPLLREKAKAARHAHDELQALTMSTQYDKAKAKSLADAGARALGELAFMRADGEHQIYLALTDEQREQLEMLRRTARRP